MQTDATLLDGTFVRLHTLLGVVAQSLKPVKRLATCEWTQQRSKLLAEQCLISSFDRGVQTASSLSFSSDLVRGVHARAIFEWQSRET